MNRQTSPNDPFFSPLTPDWTVADLLEWTGAGDARCHDERLAGVMDAAARALGAQPLGAGVGVIARVRLVAARVAADAVAGERTLGSAVAGWEEMTGVAVPSRASVLPPTSAPTPAPTNVPTAVPSTTWTPVPTSARDVDGAFVGA